MMTRHEYEFMTGKWSGPQGAAYNQVYAFCKRMKWFMGLSDHGEPIPTEKGLQAILGYKENDWKKIDVI